MVQNVAHLIQESTSLEVECIDRMYLNAYVPRLQFEGGVAAYIKGMLEAKVVSTCMVAPMSRGFVRRIESFAKARDIPVVQFRKGDRKDDIAKSRLAKFSGDEGVVFIGKAQEKARVPRTERRRRPDGSAYPWVVSSTAMVNHFYFYIVDRDFGPLFIKFCTYFPFTGRVCLNGNEWLKRQLDRRGIGFEPLDNGIASCEDLGALNRIARQLSAKKINAVVRKWFRRLPNPYTDRDRYAGYDYDLSILQSEFSLTQMFDRPRTGRVFFEEVIRENLDLGRPDNVALIFKRRVTRQTPGHFRTRVITDGVIPSLHINYKNTRIKQYYKEGRALRTETTINDTRDFEIGKRLHNLPALQEVGYKANRRLLNVQTTSHDCRIGERCFEAVSSPATVENQRASALRFGCPRVQALMQALVLFCLLPRGFSNRDLRQHVAVLLGLDPADYSQGRMTYDLRRLRLHGLIQRVPKSYRYRVTKDGLRVALFYARAHTRFFRTGLSLESALGNRKASTALRKAAEAIDRLLEEANLAA